MFGYQDGYNPFPSRSNVYAEDLMSLNTIGVDDVEKKRVLKIDSRSLKTDDIAGAKPRAGVR